MIIAVYVVVAASLFFAQLRNGFFTALLTAAFWPIVIPGVVLLLTFRTLYYGIKK